MISCHRREVIVSYRAKDILYLIVHWLNAFKWLILQQPDTFIHIISLTSKFKPKGKAPCESSQAGCSDLDEPNFPGFAAGILIYTQ